MFLGVRGVLVKSFARIHRDNLINFGILPMVFVNPTDYDDQKRPTRINYLDGTFQTMNYDCCGLTSSTDE